MQECRQQREESASPPWHWRPRLEHHPSGASLQEGPGALEGVPHVAPEVVRLSYTMLKRLLSLHKRRQREGLADVCKENRA